VNTPNSGLILGKIIYAAPRACYNESPYEKEIALLFIMRVCAAGYDFV
jgi:hypothetical protein